jgi:endonuclease-3
MEKPRAVETQRINKALGILKETYPGARIALDFRSPFEMLVAVILSAQCTDERVNKVTPVLFRRLPDVKAMADVALEELEEIVRPTGFFRNKAKNIKNAARIIRERFGGEVPRTMEALLELPGVARKTANIVLYSAYGVIAGIAVDTHVKRVSMRLGFTEHDDPVKIEQDLMKLVPREDWGLISYVFIDHGRRICPARRPRCAECPVRELCPSAQ